MQGEDEKASLTVHNVEIQTPTITIGVMKVGRKQVTLAVFRQLREAGLVSKDGYLVGRPWGVVNYHPDKCAEAEPHWHVVWQQGDQLRRAAVDIRPSFPVFGSDEGDRFIASWVHDLIVDSGDRWVEKDSLTTNLARYEDVVTRLSDGLPVSYGLTAEGRRATAAWIELQDNAENLRERGPNEWLEKTVLDNKRRLAAAMEKFTAQVAAFGATTSELATQHQAVVDAERQRRRRHIEVRRQLAELPQLFIAV